MFRAFWRMIDPILKKMSEVKLWSARLPEMVKSCFADLTQGIRVVRKGGKAWIVGSTSAYGGIEIPVDLILADIATSRGWKLEGIHLLRNMRAAGQHWAFLEPGSSHPLRESLIVLEK